MQPAKGDNYKRFREDKENHALSGSLLSELNTKWHEVEMVDEEGFLADAINDHENHATKLIGIEPNNV